MRKRRLPELQCGKRPAAYGSDCALEDREGSIWLGYSGHGLARWLGRNQWQSFAEDEGLADAGIWRIVRDAAGDLWIGTNHGLFRGTRKDGRWRFRRSDAVGKFTVYGLAAESDGSLWVGTFQSQTQGLLRYNPRTGKKLIYLPSRPFPQFAIYEINRDALGTIWVATPRGVVRLVPGGATLEPVPLPIDGTPVFDIKTSGNGLFVASKRGLYIQQGAMRRLLTTADGLKDNWVQSILIGPDGDCGSTITLQRHHTGRPHWREGSVAAFHGGGRPSQQCRLLAVL